MFKYLITSIMCTVALTGTTFSMDYKSAYSDLSWQAQKDKIKRISFPEYKSKTDVLLQQLIAKYHLADNQVAQVKKSIDGVEFLDATANLLSIATHIANNSQLKNQDSCQMKVEIYLLLKSIYDINAVFNNNATLSQNGQSHTETMDYNLLCNSARLLSEIYLSDAPTIARNTTEDLIESLSALRNQNNLTRNAIATAWYVDLYIRIPHLMQTEFQQAQVMQTIKDVLKEVKANKQADINQPKENGSSGKQELNKQENKKISACPVCWETMNERCSGWYCLHEFCETCCVKLSESVDNCPLCREKRRLIPIVIK